MTLLDARGEVHGVGEAACERRPDGRAASTFALLVQGLASDVAGLHGLQPRIRSEGALDPRPEVRGVVLQVVSEAIANAGRHAGASQVEVVLDGARQRVVVSDDGTGFNPMIRPPGHGLRRIRSLAASVGASFAVRSSRGQGTTVELSFGA